MIIDCSAYITTGMPFVTRNSDGMSAAFMVLVLFCKARREYFQSTEQNVRFIWITEQFVRNRWSHQRSNENQNNKLCQQPYHRCDCGNVCQGFSRAITLPTSLKDTKNCTRDMQKWFQIPTKSMPRNHSRAKRALGAAQRRKKSKCGGRVPPQTRKKEIKLLPQKTPRSDKIARLHQVPNNNDL